MKLQNPFSDPCHVVIISSPKYFDIISSNVIGNIILLNTSWLNLYCGLRCDHLFENASNLTQPTEAVPPCIKLYLLQVLKS